MMKLTFVRPTYRIFSRLTLQDKKVNAFPDFYFISEIQWSEQPTKSRSNPRNVCLPPRFVKEIQLAQIRFFSTSLFRIILYRHIGTYQQSITQLYIE